MSGTQDEISCWQTLDQLETVVDIGGCCHWCDDPLEPGQVVARAENGQRIHEDHLPCRGAAAHGYCSLTG